ncbi:hypothetical protein MSTE_03585 [Mycobacteroides stephanolepidis]|uniref:Cthe-2314-like HEPN domain-containing protein n=2 Tax=[Mycobacterium] stephanolepidis TaxID=1520670 RepID=A0A1Z4F0X1_9MYCO|nr:hypothetical protein MSTE_03585 [[Mycobacterium] stephanolepidis]
MRALLLQFLGAFSNVQNFADEMVARIFFQARLGIAAEKVWSLAVRRIRDEERVPLFIAIAEEVESDADLSHFEETYKRCKEMRDRIAHSVRFTPDGEHLVTIQRTIIGSVTKPIPEPVEVDRSQLKEAIRDCSWLHTQMSYAMSSGGLVVKTMLRDVPHYVPKPAARPDEWGGIRLAAVEE